jgi:hypothetical protein
MFSMEMTIIATRYSLFVRGSSFFVILGIRRFTDASIPWLSLVIKLGAATAPPAEFEFIQYGVDPLDMVFAGEP